MIQTISPQNAADWLASGEAVLIDVREPNEFMAEHIAYANSLPLSHFESAFSGLQLPEKRKIIFQCLKGKRGEQACIHAKTYHECKNDIYNMDGGISAWKQAKMPTINTSPNLSIFRQVQIIIGGLIVFLIALGFIGIAHTYIVAEMIAAALFLSGITGWCGLAMVLQKMPWNK